MKRIFLIVLAVLLMSVLSCTQTPSPQEEETFNWRFATTSTEPEEQYKEPLALAELIEEGSGGRVKVEVYPVGTLCAMEEIAEAVATGAVEVGQGHGGIAAGHAPSSATVEAPWVMRSCDDLYDVHLKGGLGDILREDFMDDGMHYLAVEYQGMLNLITNFPINSAEDFRGKLLWVPAADVWIEELDAVVTEVPGFDMYMGLKLGTIEGIKWLPSGLRDLNLWEVAGYVMEPSIGPTAVQVFVNLDAWNALGPELQDQIQDYVDENFPGVCYDIMETYQQNIISEAKEKGVIFLTPTEEELDKIQSVARNYWYQEGLNAGSYSAEAVKLIKDWAVQKGIW